MYVIDTSAVLDAWVRYYPRDVFPTLYEQLEALALVGELRCPDEVLRELERSDDGAFEWVDGIEGLALPLSQEVQQATREILTRFPKMVDTRPNRGRADPFVIALARVERAVVVTAETAPGNENRPSIPFVCRHYGVTFINLLRLIRDQGWRFT